MGVLRSTKWSCLKMVVALTLLIIISSVQVHGSRDMYYVHSTSEDTSGRCICTVMAPSPDVCSDDAQYHYIKDLETQVANLTTLVQQLANRTSSALDLQTTMTMIQNLTSQLDVLEADRHLLLTEHFNNIRDEIQAMASLLPQLQTDSADALMLQAYHTQLSNLSGVLSTLQEQHGMTVSELQQQVMELTNQLNNCDASKELFCANQPCMNEGVCLDGFNGFICFCAEGWTGKQCDEDVDECIINPCGTGGQCINNPGNYTCSCANGYEGMPCRDINECDDDPCHDNATCSNTDGSFTCTCNSGFAGDGQNCQDRDECMFSDRCPPNSVCINTIGGYYCNCDPGFSGLECTHIDECFFGSCPLNSYCINTNGGFHCECHPGFSGPECTEITTTALPSTFNFKTTTLGSDSALSTAPEETTTMMAATTTARPTTEPPPDISWAPGESVSTKNKTYADGTTEYVYSGWKVDPAIVEEISDAAARTGQQCWHYKSGTNYVSSTVSGSETGPGDKTPFSPGLSVKVGRSDGSYTGDADSFYVSFWFKMAHDYSGNFGDGTRIMVVAGDPSGTTASSNYLEIKFEERYRGKLSIRTKESSPSYTECAQSRDCGDDFGGIYNTIADRLDPTTWHHVEMTLRTRPQDYMDEWFYVIDGNTANPSQGGAYYKTQQYDEGRYLYVNRVSFVALYPTTDATKRGIYFDDISYKAYDSSNPNAILDEYNTSFEAVEN